MEQVVSRDGTPVAVWRSGGGPSLLLVHGTTADHTRWSSLLPLLEPHFTVHAMDRRGRGESGDGPAYDIMREAEDVAAVVDAIGGTVFVLGHSYGAVCSLEASLLTDKIGRLILYEPPIGVGAAADPSVPNRMQALIDAGERGAALEMFFRDVVGVPEEELNGLRGRPVWQTRLLLVPTIPRELLLDKSYRFDPGKFAGQGLPTLLLLGGDSPAGFRSATEAVHSALPDSRVVILPGQRHVAMDGDPAGFVRVIRRFLADEPTRAEPQQAAA